jgi:hypothetical protein
MTLAPALLTATANAVLGLQLNEPERRTVAHRFAQSTGHAWVKRWDAAFVHYAGYWSHFDQRSGRSTWPLPATAACHDLARFARATGVLSHDAPQAGELLLLWSPRRRMFVRTGIILAVEPPETRPNGMRYYECHTIEGCVTPTARLDGDRMGRVSRFLSPEFGDRTIRWIDLEQPEVSVRQRSTGAQREFEELHSRRLRAQAIDAGLGTALGAGLENERAAAAADAGRAA